MNNNSISYRKNTISYNFETKQERVGELLLSNEVIENCSKTLALAIIDYMKKGGDLKHLTPENLFKPQKENDLFELHNEN